MQDAAIEAYDETMKVSSSLGQKLDLVFAKIRSKRPIWFINAISSTCRCALFVSLTFCALAVGLFWNDMELIKKQIEVAQEMLTNGGDWERRNRLKAPHLSGATCVAVAAASSSAGYIGRSYTGTMLIYISMNPTLPGLRRPVFDDNSRLRESS